MTTLNHLASLASLAESAPSLATALDRVKSYAERHNLDSDTTENALRATTASWEARNALGTSAPPPNLRPLLTKMLRSIVQFEATLATAPSPSTEYERHLAQFAKWGQEEACGGKTLSERASHLSLAERIAERHIAEAYDGTTATAPATDTDSDTDSDTELEAVRDELEEARDELNDIERELGDLRSELDAVRDERDEMERERDEMESLLEEARDERDEMERERDQMERERDEARSALAKISESLRALRALFG